MQTTFYAALRCSLIFKMEENVIAETDIRINKL